MINKKNFLDFISPHLKKRVGVITVVAMATHVAPFYSLLYGGGILLWKPDREVQIFHFTSLLIKSSKMTIFFGQVIAATRQILEQYWQESACFLLLAFENHSVRHSAYHVHVQTFYTLKRIKTDYTVCQLEDQD